jgi:hypothetical protein
MTMIDENVWSMLENNIDNLEFVNEELHNNEEFMAKAIGINIKAVKFMGESLNYSAKVAIAILHHVPWIYTSLGMRYHPDVALAALKISPHNYNFLPEDLKTHEQIQNYVKTNPDKF